MWESRLVRTLGALALFALTGLIASAAGGFVCLFLLLTWSAGPAKVLLSAILAAMLGPWVGAVYGSVPAAVAGALMAQAVKADRRLDAITVWLAAGALAGLAAFALYDPVLGLPGPDAPRAPD